MTMTAYSDLPALADVYLEDSFILNVSVTPGVVEVHLDVVLLENHGEYAVPDTSEQYCFRRGVLRFVGVQHINWQMPTGRPAIDASGETDYGGLDSYTIQGAMHSLIGELGALTVTCDGCTLILDVVT